MPPRYWKLLQAYSSELTKIDGRVQRAGLNGEGSEGVYGSIIFPAQLELTSDLMRHGELPSRTSNWVPGQEPVVVDFGAGIGRALLLWRSLNLFSSAIGYEVDEIKVTKARLYMRKVVTEACKSGCFIRTDLPILQQRSIEQVTPAELIAARATIGYSFWVGTSDSAKRAIGRLFLAVGSMKALVLVDFRQRQGEVLPKLMGLGSRSSRGGHGSSGSGGPDVALSAGPEPQPEQQLELFIDRVVPGMISCGRKGTYTAFIVKKRPRGSISAPVDTQRELERNREEGTGGGK